MKTDALNRRSRFAQPQPLDGAIVLSERDLRLFEALDRHGTLPTNLLYAFTKDAGRNYNHLQHRLTQLYNGCCRHPDHRSKAPEGHACRPLCYLSKDPAQFNNFAARHQFAMYELTAHGRLALAERDRLSPFPIKRSASFVHDLFAGCVTASAELLAGPNRFIFRGDILSHPKCPPETRRAADPFAIAVDGQTTIPDDLFGLAYAGGGFRFFAVEIDRATERINTRQPASNSIARKVKAYDCMMAERTYTRVFGLPNLTVLFATTGAAHLETMVEHVRANVDPSRHSRFLFKAFPSFGRSWAAPRDMLPVFEPWISAQGEVDVSKAT